MDIFDWLSASAKLKTQGSEKAKRHNWQLGPEFVGKSLATYTQQQLYSPWL